MELARVIQGSELMITSMGGPSALCLCLGKTMMLESRKNETHERLEINYPARINIQYF
jgi:antitoxin (DNA-binding transcriptional repressor) of toxin-antitoxin stability system